MRQFCKSILHKPGNRTVDLLVDYSMRFIGDNYKWGGDDPMGGWDCSGFIQEVLAAVGCDPMGDQTADGIYRIFKNFSTKILCRGSLVFFGSEAKIIHVAMAIDSKRMVEAGGGGSKTKSRLEAERQNAFVRVRPVALRRDFHAALLPDYDTLIKGGFKK